jgi:hypothetical protein
MLCSATVLMNRPTTSVIYAVLAELHGTLKVKRLDIPSDKMAFYSVLLTLPELAVTGTVWCLTTDWTTGIRSPAEANDLSSSLCVQTGSEAHPASCPVGTGGPFPGV